MSGKAGSGGVDVTIEPTLADAEIDRFYAFYLDAFKPLLRNAAARHSLRPEEFAEEMRDRRIDKYVGWNRAGVAVGLTTLTTDLDAVPWIEREFYESRYPDHAEQGRLYYLGYALMDPSATGTFGVFRTLIDAVLQAVTDAGGVMAFDIARYNVGRAPGKVVDRMRTRFGARVEEVDVQTYYIADFGRPPPD